MTDQPLDGTVALVTGAGGGTGAATARRLARAGAAVAVAAGRRDRLERVAAEIAESGGQAVAVDADLTGPEGAEDAVQHVLDRLGRLDILVNSAEVMLLNSALHTTVEEWDRMVAVNVASLLHITHAAVPHLIYAASTSPRQVADLVNVGSADGRAARPGSSVYSLTTSGLAAFTASLRKELLGERVRVGIVEPATMDGAVDGGPGALRPEDVADAIGYIVTREARVAVSEMLVHAGDPTP